MGIVSKSQSGRVCAEPASRPSAPRSGGGAKRRALTSVSTRARCWLDDAASDHNILRSAGVESPSDPRARQHPVILRYGPPSRRAAHPHSINLGRRHSRSPAPRQVGRTARDAARFAGGHGEHKVAEVRFDWGLQEQGGARYTRWECATVRRVDLAGARKDAKPAHCRRSGGTPGCRASRLGPARIRTIAIQKSVAPAWRWPPQMNRYRSLLPAVSAPNDHVQRVEP